MERYRIEIMELLDRETLLNVTNYGAQAGWPGFTYYNDTIAFFNRHKAEIRTLLKSEASGLGESITTMVSSFNCLKAYDISEDEIAEVIFGGANDEDDNVILIKNALAWYALETVAREVGVETETEDDE